MEATREEVVKYLMGNRKSSDSQKNLTGPMIPLKIIKLDRNSANLLRAKV
jgi:hypothetical protein